MKRNNMSILSHLSIYLMVSLLLALTAARPASAQSPTGPTGSAEIEAFFDGALNASMIGNHVAGAVVVVVKDGAVLFAKGYGYADLETNTPVDPAATLFRPGSVSKLFTWTAVMQLVEQGKLDLDADVNTYIDFEIPAAFAEPITLHHLLTHTPGFEDKGEGLFRIDPDQMVNLREYLTTAPPARVFPPGTVGAYSNYGTALAGYIVERVSGMPFHQYVQQNIFDPLGMQHATFEQPLPAALAADMSAGYHFFNGGYEEGSFEYVVAYPAGSMSATGLDMARFMIAHLQNGEYEGARILSEATAQQMHSLLRAPDPRISGMAYGFFQDTLNGQYVISHGGDTVLFHSTLKLVPEHNLGIFLSTNTTSGSNVIQEVSDAFFDHYFPQEPAALTPAADFQQRASTYAGSYLLSRRSFTTLEKLITQMNPITVTVDAENNLVLPLMGEVEQFVETEPGLLVNRGNPDIRMVLVQQDGATILETGHPFIFTKAAWYDSLNLHGFIFIGGAVLFLVTIIAWLVSFFTGLTRRERRPLLSRLARLAAGLFGFLLILFILMMSSLITDILPGFGVPAIYFTDPPILDTLLFMPVLMLILGVAMAGFAVTAWARRYWTAGGRVFYTMVTLFAFAALWGLYYWNLLL